MHLSVRQASSRAPGHNASRGLTCTDSPPHSRDCPSTTPWPRPRWHSRPGVRRAERHRCPARDQGGARHRHTALPHLGRLRNPAAGASDPAGRAGRRSAARCNVIVREEARLFLSTGRQFALVDRRVEPAVLRRVAGSIGLDRHRPRRSGTGGDGPHGARQHDESKALPWTLLAMLAMTGRLRRSAGRWMPRARPGAMALLVGSLCVGLAYALVIHAMRAASAGVVAYTNTGIVLATVMSLLVFRERMQWRQRAVAAGVICAGATACIPGWGELQGEGPPALARPWVLVRPRAALVSAASPGATVALLEGLGQRRGAAVAHRIGHGLEQSARAQLGHGQRQSPVGEVARRGGAGGASRRPRQTRCATCRPALPRSPATRSRQAPRAAQRAAWPAADRQP